MIVERIMPHLPVLLALTCNSPFWEGRITGLHSSRSKVMEGLPTAGLPLLIRNWSEYTWLINHLIETGFINTIREIWWDVRPHHNFGTVEIRICDMPGNLHDTLAVVALMQCLVKALSDDVDQGTYQQDYHPMMIRQNKWRACRYGLDANLVDCHNYAVRPVRELLHELVEWLRPTARECACECYLERVLQMAKGPSWSDRQLTLLQETGSPAATVRCLTEQSRVSAA
jgi:carboxylate-amine ligase